MMSVQTILILLGLLLPPTVGLLCWLATDFYRWLARLSQEPPQ